VIGTYAAVLAICASSLAIGQAAICVCGWRRWSWLSPAVGLAVLTAVCWATVRMPGHGTVSAVVVAVLTLGSVAWLWGRLEAGGGALRVGWPVALIALLAASLPFAVEGHFGILGTSFNPDMSQHLLTADRLAHGETSQLLRQGYPLGPHSVVVALNRGLGIGLVQGFSGLTVAVAILAPLTALAAFAELRAAPRTAAALLVGLAYVVASYFAQGAFKETMQALYLLAFVLALREATGPWRERPLRLVPAALLAVGSIYTYSFPGLLWLGGTFVIWAITEALRNGRARKNLIPLGSGEQSARSASASPAGGTGEGSSPAVHEDEGPSPGTGPAGSPLGPSPVKAALLALLVFVVLTAPELGRMIEFHSFETFDPNGPGLGNLFGQVSPFEVLGIWPSGDFRLAPGGGAVPAAAYYLGIAFALVLLVYGAWCSWRRREVAVLSGLGAVALAYLAARLGGTPYTSAKAIEIAAPIVALTILLPLREIPWFLPDGTRPEGTTGSAGGRRATLGTAAGVLFVAAAAVCTALALANAPVGPTSYSPALTEMRPLVASDSTLVLASPTLLADDHGSPYISWELRGGRVCIAADGELDHLTLGVRFVVTEGSSAEAPFPGLHVRRVAPPYVLWETNGAPRGKSPCPLIAVRQARQGPAR
jgi:hypothetical protein